MNNKVKEKPITTGELFRLIDKKVREKRPELFKMIENSWASREEKPIRNYEWFTSGKIIFGNNEGMFLDILLTGDTGNENEKEILAGTYRTLHRDYKAICQLGELTAEVISEMNEYVEKNMDAFTWTGYTVFKVQGEKKTPSYECATLDGAKMRAGELLKDPDARVVIRNNETRETTEYVCCEQEIAG